VRVLVVAPFGALSGYGNDGQGLAAALDRLGCDVHLFPTSLGAPVSETVGRLLTKWPQPPYDLTIVHLSPVDEQIEQPALRACSERIVLWSMWEYRTFEDPHAAEARARMEKTGYDAIVAYDSVSAEAFSSEAFNPGVSVFKVQGGYEPEFWLKVDPRQRDWSGVFRFGMLGALNARKAPWTAIKAFGALRDAHGDRFQAELHLKSSPFDLIPPQVGERWPGIHVYREWWPPHRVREFYAGLHCLLAPSEGEGKNLPALEAQTTGVPVIATDFGGHREWLSPEWGYPLRYEEVHREGAGIGAKVSVDDLAEQMWRVYTRRDEARRKGEIARNVIPSMCSWDQAVRRLLDVLG
jgi:glycosyltransferase involved in cell wall biosynthesis